MASENETFEESIAAVRKMIHECPAIKGGLGEFGYQLKANCAIDRIEAAHGREVAELRRRLKVAEEALSEASDAFRFCIEQCELELGPRMIGKLCDDGKAVERALDAIREEGGAK